MNMALTSRSLSDLAPEVQFQMLKLTDTYDFGDYSFGWVVRPREWKAEIANLFAALKEAREAGDTTTVEAAEALLTTFFTIIGQDKGLLRRTCANLSIGYQEASA